MIRDVICSNLYTWSMCFLSEWSMGDDFCFFSAVTSQTVWVTLILSYRDMWSPIPESQSFHQSTDHPDTSKSCAALVTARSALSTVALPFVDMWECGRARRTGSVGGGDVCTCPNIYYITSDFIFPRSHRHHLCVRVRACGHGRLCTSTEALNTDSSRISRSSSHTPRCLPVHKTPGALIPHPPPGQWKSSRSHSYDALTPAPRLLHLIGWRSHSADSKGGCLQRGQTVREGSHLVEWMNPFPD